MNALQVNPIGYAKLSQFYVDSYHAKVGRTE